MAVCSACNGEMKTVDGCSGNVFVVIKREQMETILHGGDRRCHDCNCLPGNPHHPGCDCERCPNCFRQLISCGCLREKDRSSMWNTRLRPLQQQM